MSVSQEQDEDREGRPGKRKRKSFYSSWRGERKDERQIEPLLQRTTFISFRFFVKVPIDCVFSYIFLSSRFQYFQFFTRTIKILIDFYL